MNTPPQPNQDAIKPLETLENSLNWGLFIAHGWACVFYVFLRRGFGRHFFSINLFLGFVVLALNFMTATTYVEIQWYRAIGYTAFSASMMFWLVPSMRRVGIEPHSKYTGAPLLSSLLGTPEKTTKLYIEPLCVLIIGCSFSLFAMPSLSRFFVIGAFCCYVDNAYLFHQMARRVTQMRDADVAHRVSMTEFQNHFGKP